MVGTREHGPCSHLELHHGMFYLLVVLANTMVLCFSGRKPSSFPLNFFVCAKTKKYMNMGSQLHRGSQILSEIQNP